MSATGFQRLVAVFNLPNALGYCHLLFGLSVHKYQSDVATEHRRGTMTLSSPHIPEPAKALCTNPLTGPPRRPWETELSSKHRRRSVSMEQKALQKCSALCTLSPARWADFSWKIHLKLMLFTAFCYVVDRETAGLSKVA